MAEQPSGTTIIVTSDQLQQVMPRLARNPKELARIIDPLNAAMVEFKIYTPMRVAAFLAQVAHESGEFRWMEEIWGPTKQQLRYEPPSGLAAQLGNEQKNDGVRYKGRGPIQLTGRANYRHFGELLDLPLEDQPELAAEYSHGIRIAACYWHNKDLNRLADQGEFVRITERINGGVNGLAERQAYYQRAKNVLGVGSA
jgi:putative chitinase